MVKGVEMKLERVAVDERASRSTWWMNVDGGRSGEVRLLRSGGRWVG
jgi:hypothetical protein